MFIEDPKESAFNFGWPPGTTVRICGGNYRGFTGTVLDRVDMCSPDPWPSHMKVAVHDGPVANIRIQELELVSLPEWALKLGLPDSSSGIAVHDAVHLPSYAFNGRDGEVISVDEDGMHVTVRVLYGPMEGVECRLHKASLQKLPTEEGE